MSKFKRVFLTVLDAVGVGALPGQPVSSSLEDTLKKEGPIELNNLRKMGLGNLIEDTELINKGINSFIAHFGNMRLSSNFADSWAGHWELAGVTLPADFSYYWTDGFNKEIINAFEKETGYKVIGNKAFLHRDDVLPNLLPQHLNDKKSVIVLTEEGLETIRTFGIYAHQDNISLEEQYRLCEVTTKILAKYNNVIGRVGSRPVISDSKGKFIVPDSDRKDFLIFTPPNDTLMKNLKNVNIQTYAVGKVWAMFRGEGIEDSIYTRSNDESIEGLFEFANKVDEGLIFTNLNDWDAKYGHYFDTKGWVSALEKFDNQLSALLDKLRDDDLLILCADGHGCDPVNSALHTREYSPLIVYHNGIVEGKKLNGEKHLCDIEATIADIFNAKRVGKGTSFLKEIIE